ncbi:hypothetical protein K450DRAFT_283372 [Umbelopsis ramanniana AG]|uniref:Uncharacterized protein n=1 Tax=Umbelopsis ramanniana AG TaxID=1314678 RepID=A0AAD5HBV9_UMBRA|nr:uncharacterized protein K450DRAFT_283372 [Umbelopsis ramanniana AG]KAI8576603.1 hypothetical protein K450DRAFT_283372 [Umbelopsis ramanniana AG]
MATSTATGTTTTTTTSTNTLTPTTGTHTTTKTTTAKSSTTSHGTTTTHETTTEETSTTTTTVASTMYITTSGLSSVLPISLNISAFLATSLPTSTSTTALPSMTPNGLDCSLDSVHAVNGLCSQGYYCNFTTSFCQSQLADGSACSLNTTCVSDYCINGLCTALAAVSSGTDSDEHGLSKGAVAGVAVGSITGAAAILAFGVLLLRRRRTRPVKFNRGKGITPSMVFSDADGSSRFSMLGGFSTSKSPTGFRNSSYSFSTPAAAMGSNSNSWTPTPPSEKTTATIDYYYNVPQPPSKSQLITRPMSSRQSTRSSAARLSKYNYLAQAFSQMRTSYANGGETDSSPLALDQAGHSVYNSRDALRAGSVAADSLSQALGETDGMVEENANNRTNRDSDVIPSSFNHQKQPRYQMASMYSTFSRDSDIIEPIAQRDSSRTSGFAAPLFQSSSPSEAGPQTANQIELSPMVGQLQVSPVVPRITLFNEDNEEEVLADPRITSGPLDSTTLLGLGDSSTSFRDSFTSEVSRFSTDSNPFRARMAAKNASTDAWTQEDGDINKKAIPPSSSTYQYF